MRETGNKRERERDRQTRAVLKSGRCGCREASTLRQHLKQSDKLCVCVYEIEREREREKREREEGESEST